VKDEFPNTRKTFVIVGVSHNAHDHSLRHEVPRRFYLSAQQRMGEFSPAIPINSAKPLVSLLDDNLRQERMIAQLSMVFGGLALLPARRASRVDPLIALRYE
jgi:hypothetical protein